MDLNLFKLFKLDIDELINEFVQCESNTFAEFKRVWLSRKFSYIFEASPSTNQGFFMQSLYAHSISYMVSTDSFAYRLGGLYCMYCLFETQPFKPPFKIYLSLGELTQLKNLVIEAKAVGVKVVVALLKGMLERNMFLFGFVGDNESSATERVTDLTDVQNAQIQAAYKKLFANTRLEHFIHMDMGTELECDLFKKTSSEYAAAKELAIKEASQKVDVENIKHISENQRLIGDVVEKIATDWKSQKELLYQQTGFDHLSAGVTHQEEGDEFSQRQDSNGNKKRKEGRDDLGVLEEQEDPEEDFSEYVDFLEQGFECDDEEAEEDE